MLKMAALFRIAVILAVIYLIRVAVAHQTEWKHSSSSKSQENEESLSGAGEGYNEQILIRSGVPLRGRTIHHTVWSKEARVSESGEGRASEPSNGVSEFMEGVSESRKDRVSESSDDRVEEFRDENQNTGEGSNEKVLIRSGVPLRGRKIHHTAWSKEDRVSESGKSGVSESKKAVSESRKGISESSNDRVIEFSDEKLNTGEGSVLIRSGEPLRGITIHHTAWSKEDSASESSNVKVSEPIKDRVAKRISENISGSSDDSLTRANVEIEDEKFYSGWSLRKALNYVLSFLYDLEDDDITDSPLTASSENKNQKRKLWQEDADETNAPHPGDLRDYPIKNATYIGDSFLQATPSYLIVNFQNQGTERLDDLDNEVLHTIYQYDGSELSYEDTDSECEEEMSFGFDEDSDIYQDQKSQEEDIKSKTTLDTSNDDSAIDEHQENQQKDINSKIISVTLNTIPDISTITNLPNIIEKESKIDNKHLLREMQESEEMKRVSKKFEEDDINSNEDTKTASSNIDREIVNEVKMIKETIRHNEEPPEREKAIDSEHLSIDTNLEFNKQTNENIGLRKYKEGLDMNSIPPENEEDEVTSTEIYFSSLNLDSNYPVSNRETARSNKQLGIHVGHKNSVASTEGMFTEDTFNEKAKKKDCPLHVVGKDVGNNFYDDETSERISLKKRIGEEETSISNTHNQDHPQSKTENKFFKFEPTASYTQEQSQHSEGKKMNKVARLNSNKKENIVIGVEPTSPSLQRHPQQKEQTREPAHHEHHAKPKSLLIKSRQERKHQAIYQNATTELQYEPVLMGPHYDAKTTTVKSIVYSKDKPAKIPANRKPVQTPQNKLHKMNNSQSWILSKKPSRNKDSKYLKRKKMLLSDMYLDLEPDDNVGSYNYILDSFEFIRVDENRDKKFTKKQKGKNEKHGFQKKVTHVLQVPLAPNKHQKQHEVNEKSPENFGTILEYLYKNSNSSFLLSLKEYNSSEILI